MRRSGRKSQQLAGKCYSTPVETSVVAKRALDQERLLATARLAMEIEAQSILTASSRLAHNLLEAIVMIADHPGKVIVTGMGKSGHIARKIAATLQSTGTPALFLHPAEAAHGDLGVCQTGDPVLMISKSGSTGELIELIPALRELRVGLIGILGNTKSPLAREMDVVFDASVQREADPGGFTPTSSTAVALAIGDALAVGLMEARGFTADHFSQVHAGGQLGRNLRLRVRDVMHSGDEVAWVAPEDSLKHVVIAMSKRALGAACVIGPGGSFAGLITDGDVRRALQEHDDIRTLAASDVMTKSPVSVGPEALVHDALGLMEDRPSQISVLPVLEGDRCLGLIRLHDIYRGGIA